MLVLGLGGAVITLKTGDVSVSITGMSLAAIVGILLNLLLPKTNKEKTNKEKEEVKEIKVNETKKVTVKKPNTKNTNTKKKSVKRK